MLERNRELYAGASLHIRTEPERFPDFVANAPLGPLFYRMGAKTNAKSGAEIISGRISEWLGSLAIIPDGVSPSHGWRHRFKTVGRELGQSDRVIDAICGHAVKTAGDNYGDVTVLAKARVIETFPRYKIASIYGVRHQERPHLGQARRCLRRWFLVVQSTQGAA